MKFDIEAFKRGTAGNCEVRGCHNKAEFRIGLYMGKSVQFICNYHIGSSIKRLMKSED